MIIQTYFHTMNYNAGLKIKQTGSLHFSNWRQNWSCKMEKYGSRILANNYVRKNVFVTILLLRKWFQTRRNIPGLKKIIWVIGILRRTVVGQPCLTQLRWPFSIKEYYYWKKKLVRMSYQSILLHPSQDNKRTGEKQGK